MSAQESIFVPGYRIERCLGAGGMGKVYLACQESLDRLVALKLLSAKYAGDPAFVERFVKEARSAGKLSHENIVAAVDVGEAGGQYYFVMEYVPGRPLSEIIKEEAPLAEQRALELCRQIARGLRHAHAQGFIHRDIKPSNILLTPEGVAKICDLGLAREIGIGGAAEEGLMHGTPAYASSEQCRGARDVDHRSDLYSLGITLFEMLTGTRPFQGACSKDLARQHLKNEPPAPRSLNPGVSAAAGLLRILLQAKPGPWSVTVTRSLTKDFPNANPLARDFGYWHWGTVFLAQREGRKGALWSQWSQGVFRELLPLLDPGHLRAGLLGAPRSMGSTWGNRLCHRPGGSHPRSSIGKSDASEVTVDSEEGSSIRRESPMRTPPHLHPPSSSIRVNSRNH